jgi:hypothetical protein
LIACWADGITSSLATRFTKSAARFGPRPPAAAREAGIVEFANLPHDFAETLELVFVGFTIIASLVLMVAFGHWWQK